MAIRINPDQVTGTLSGTGVANASASPYNFRSGKGVRGVVVYGSSTNTTDTIQIVVTRPGVTLSANTAAKIYAANGVGAVGVLTCPFSVVLDYALLGGDCDIYVYAGTQTGTLTYTIQRLEAEGNG